MWIQTNRKVSREEGQGRGRRECYLVSQSPVCRNSMKQWAQKTKDQIVLSLKKKSASRSNRGELLVYILTYFRWTVLSSATKWIRFKDPLSAFTAQSQLFHHLEWRAANPCLEQNDWCAWGPLWAISTFYPCSSSVAQLCPFNLFLFSF